MHSCLVVDRSPAPGVFPRGYRPVTAQGGSETESVVAADVILESDLAPVIDA